MKIDQIPVMLSACGFVPPSAGWTWQNPRGAEFGQWTVREMPVGWAAEYAATETDIRFTIRFLSDPDLAAWIAHTF